ncbi:MAG: hypothetical protein JWP49_2731 [Phenylobacterium sp.]|nr:hypothetical protein [Phenylobacterium sp.]
MNSPSQYRERAAAARQAAEHALTPELRASLLRVEATWLALATTAELVAAQLAQDQADAAAAEDDDARPRRDRSRSPSRD